MMVVLVNRSLPRLTNCYYVLSLFACKGLHANGMVENDNSQRVKEVSKMTTTKYLRFLGKLDLNNFSMQSQSFTINVSLVLGDGW